MSCWDAHREVLVCQIQLLCKILTEHSWIGYWWLTEALNSTRKGNIFENIFWPESLLLSFGFGKCLSPFIFFLIFNGSLAPPFTAPALFLFDGDMFSLHSLILPLHWGLRDRLVYRFRSKTLNWQANVLVGKFSQREDIFLWRLKRLWIGCFLSVFAR